jgi:nucleoid-associated protein YgaU
VLGTAPQRVLGAEANRPPNGSNAAATPTIPTRPTDGPPPELAARYDRWLAMQPTKESPRAASEINRNAERAVRDAIPQGKPEPRQHKIVDGDTLAHLAERYLGDAQRAGEIHAANRKLLPQPDLLPIGVTLVIPPRTPAAGVLAEHPLRGSLDTGSEAALLVPVPAAPTRDSAQQ